MHLIYTSEKGTWKAYWSLTRKGWFTSARILRSILVRTWSRTANTETANRKRGEKTGRPIGNGENCLTANKNGLYIKSKKMVHICQDIALHFGPHLIPHCKHRTNRKRGEKTGRPIGNGELYIVKRWFTSARILRSILVRTWSRTENTQTVNRK
jgi:hypothetical protein